MGNVTIVSGPNELAREAAETFARLAREAAESRGSFTVSLSGGQTPKRFYGLLPADPYRQGIPWDRTFFFLGDERGVPPTHVQSNFRMISETLLSPAPVPRSQIFRFRSELEPPDEVVDDYEQALRKHFEIRHGEFPRFDLVLLGLGADGHTGSLFPGSGAITEENRLAAAVPVGTPEAVRYTITPPVLNHAAAVVFLVSGSKKAEALRAVLEGDHDPNRYPAQVVRPTRGHVRWIVDAAAASLLRDTPR